MSDFKVIDDNMHFLPTNLFEDEYVLHGFLYSAPICLGVQAYLDKTPDGSKQQIVLATDTGEEILNYVEGDYTLETKINAMDEAGVDICMLRMPVWQEWLPLEICKVVNDQSSAMVEASEGRLRATACVPPYGRKEDIAELERCMNELGMVGVQMACAYGNKFLDNALFDSYMAYLNEKKIPAVIHHTPGQNCFGNVIDMTIMRREFGRVTAQATAVGREIYSGMFNKYPNLIFDHTMMGGNWFGLQELCAPHASKKKEAMDRLQGEITREDYDKFLKNNIYFDACHPASWGISQLECAVKVCGADHILMGSSFPVFYWWLAKSVETINALNIPEEEKALIKGGNAAKLFNIQ